MKRHRKSKLVKRIVEIQSIDKHVDLENAELDSEISIARSKARASAAKAGIEEAMFMDMESKTAVNMMKRAGFDKEDIEEAMKAKTHVWLAEHGWTVVNNAKQS